MTRAYGRMLLGVVLLLGAAVSEAQSQDESLLGSRVRVRTGQAGRAQVGVLEGATADDLVIRTKTEEPPIRIRRTDVARIEVSRGSRRHTVKGFLGGALVWGAIVGALAATDSLDESGVGEPLFVGGLLAVGAGVGTLVKTERWEGVAAGRVSLGIAPAPRGLQGRIVVRF